jgi:hypothetical protein
MEQQTPRLKPEPGRQRLLRLKNLKPTATIEPLRPQVIFHHMEIEVVKLPGVG